MYKYPIYLTLAAIALSLAASPAAADNPCPNSSGSAFDLSYYVTTFGAGTNEGCTVGNLDFSNFTYSTSGTNQIAASSVGVQEMTTPDGPGLMFDPSGFIQGAGLTQDMSVGFKVTALGDAQISDIYMGFGNVATAGTGTALYTEQFCGGPSNECSLFVEAPTTNNTNMVNLSGTLLGGPVNSLQITKELRLQTGANGLAATSSFLNEYSEVPEPRGLTILLGLVFATAFVILKGRKMARG